MSPQIPEMCTEHLARVGEKRRAYRLGLCRACYRGQAILPLELRGEEGVDPGTEADRRYRRRRADKDRAYYLRHKHKINARKRRYYRRNRTRILRELRATRRLRRVVDQHLTP